jgi:hypothetical protein
MAAEACLHSKMSFHQVLLALLLRFAMPLPTFYLSFLAFSAANKVLEPYTTAGSSLCAPEH